MVHLCGCSACLKSLWKSSEQYTGVKIRSASCVKQTQCQVEEFKFLGLTLDTHLNWKIHSENISNKCSRISGILNNLKYVLPERIKLLNSLIRCCYIIHC